MLEEAKIGTRLSMEQRSQGENSILGRTKKFAKRKFLFKTWLSAVLFILTSLMTNYGLAFPNDYTRLVDLIELEDKEKPLYVFSDFEREFDEDSHEANLDYFNQHPELIERIRKELGGEEIRWRLDTLMHRLLFVPETRKEYATIFENYCKHVTGYVLDKTNLNNPYRKLQTLDRESPIIGGNGITVFLVHNLAKEFLTKYIFSNKRRKKVKINLRSTVFLGTVGSYTTKVYLGDNGKLEFIRDNYTIWQNSAKNPYTALTVPVEETLHIGLREHTERAIRERVELSSVKDLEEVESIAEDSIAIEEAIVGGLVHALLPDFVNRYVPILPYSLIEEDMRSKGELKQYRHLKKGIQIVESIGYENALKMYSNDPMEFRKLLMQSTKRPRSTRTFRGSVHFPLIVRQNHG